ncbi:MAG: TlpA disulfide reductase family protein [Gammaproteobacteria bacterium]
MNKNYFVVVTLIVAVALGYFMYVERDEDVPPVAPQVISSAPASSSVVDFSLPDLDGNVRQISDWNGKARLINFWATWCAPCRREIPLLKKTQLEHAENNLQVIGVAVEEIGPVLAYAESAEFNYPVLVGEEDAMAAAESTGVDFVVLPFTMIVAPDGHLIETHIGEIHEDQMALIIEVFGQIQGGEIDLAGARSALKSL